MKGCIERGSGHCIRRNHPPQEIDQRRITKQRAAASTRKGVALGQCAQHHQVVVMFEKTREAFDAGEFRVRLVDDHDRLVLETRNQAFDDC